MPGGLASDAGAFGFGGRSNARSPTATSRTPSVLKTMRTTAAPAVRAAPRGDRPVPGQGVELEQEDDRTDGRAHSQRDDLSQQAAHRSTNHRRGGNNLTPKQPFLGPTRICCAATSCATKAQETCHSRTSATRTARTPPRSPRPDTATWKMARAIPLSASRTSGSSARLPAKLNLTSAERAVCSSSLVALVRSGSAGRWFPAERDLLDQLELGFQRSRSWGSATDLVPRACLATQMMNLV